MRKTLIYASAVLAAIAIAAGGWHLVSGRPVGGPVRLGIVCGVNDSDYQLCQELAARFERETGHQVAVKNASDDTTVQLSLVRELTLTRSRDIDVVMVDVIWPGMLADSLLDLSRYFEPEDLAGFFPRLVENNTVDGKLLAIPYFTDAGLLYYRTDLLEKYGFAGPPQTWDELERMAATIQEGERAEGNADFWGYVWQGAQYEGLTCDAMEWFGSDGAGNIVEADGTISVVNPAAVRSIERARDWIGTISPPETIAMQESHSLDVWRAGEAAFHRNWPYAYAVSNEPDSPVRGRVAVTTLPRGQAGVPASTLGGFQLAINRHSRHPREAAELIRFFTSPENQKYRAIAGGHSPTHQALYQDPDVLAANPLWESMPAILNSVVSRPAGITGERYDAVSNAFNTAVHRVLTGEAEPQRALAELENTVATIRGSGW